MAPGAGGSRRKRERSGGERGIRTLGAAVNSTHDFQSCTFSQLGHLSAYIRVGRKAAWTVRDCPLNHVPYQGRGGKPHPRPWLRDSMAERVGFEPTIPVLARILLFESRAFSHSATSPSEAQVMPAGDADGHD